MQPTTTAAALSSSISVPRSGDITTSIAIAGRRNSCHATQRCFSRCRRQPRQPAPAKPHRKMSGSFFVQVLLKCDTLSMESRWEFGNGSVVRFTGSSLCFPKNLEIQSLVDHYVASKLVLQDPHSVSRKILKSSP